MLFILVSCSQYNGPVLQGYIEGEYTNLSPLVPGALRKLHVSRGESVRAGQILFVLDDQPESAELKRAQANLESQQSKLKDYLSGQRSTVLAGIIAQRDQAQADLELAQSNFNRTAQLFKKGVVSKASYDEDLSKLKSSQQRVNQFEQNLKEAELGEREYRILQQSDEVKSAAAQVEESKWRLSQKTLFAPEAGLIFDTFFVEGEQIAANQPVVSLLAPRNVYVVFFIPEPIRSQIAINEGITFDCDGCKQQYTATINYISPQAEYTPPVIYSRESRSKLVYRVQAKLPLSYAMKLHPGQPVEVRLTNGNKTKHSFLRNFPWIWKK